MIHNKMGGINLSLVLHMEELSIFNAENLM